MDNTACDKGQVHGRWLVKAWWWCDPCQATTLHLSDGPAEGYDGAGWVWRWFCQDCQGIEVRVAGPLPFDGGPFEGPEAGDSSPWDAGFPEALEIAKLESARDWLMGFLGDRLLPARYVVAVARAFGIHERLLRQAKHGLGILSARWRDRWWWVPPWVPWPVGWVAGDEGGVWGVQPSLRDDPGVALDEDGLPC